MWRCEANGLVTMARKKLSTPPALLQRREKTEITVWRKVLQENRLPVIADRAVRKRMAKGQAGRRWDRVVEEVWAGIIGGIQDEMMSIGECGGRRFR